MRVLPADLEPAGKTRFSWRTALKLYKFRSFADCLSFCRARRILESGKFWCSRFYELNDPMEGVYSFSGTDAVSIPDVYSSKAKYVICSLSDRVAFENPTMWGYYASGFKGMAIEIEVDKPCSNIKQIRYQSKRPRWAGNDPESALEFLTTKLSAWCAEREFRFIAKRDPGEWSIGKITTVHFGDPFGEVVNRKCIENDSEELRKFLARRSELMDLARSKGFGCKLVTTSNGTVVERPDSASR